MHYECASESFVCPSPPSYDLHAQSLCADQARDVCDSPFFLSSWCVLLLPIFDHDVTSYSYHYVSYKSYAKINVVLKTMNEQLTYFVER